MKIIFQILTDLGYPISDNVQKYYSYIEEWQYWWEGYVEKFHEYTIHSSDGKIPRKLKRKQMRMAKKVCEDWAGLLLNDKTRILVGDGEDTNGNIDQTQTFLTGDVNEQAGGVFGNSRFWKLGNKAVERAFAQGTVCFYIQLIKPSVQGGILKAEGLKIKTIKDATQIIPLTYESDEISEIALASTHVINAKEIMYVQIFKNLGDEYEVQNYWYQIDSENASPISAPNGEASGYRLPCKPFVILRPNIENNVMDVPLGMSIYANAIDNLKACDLGFDNLFSDVLLGKKKVFMNQAAVSLMPVYAKDENGNDRVVRMDPDISETLENSLYITTGAKLPGEQQFLQEYNPDLRIDANKENIQFNLNLLSSKVGLGQKRYFFESSAMATATEVKVSNKDLTESVWKQRIEIQEVLTDLAKAVLIIGKEKCGANVDTEAKISIQFDDTMFNDEETERMRFLQEISQGVRKKWEYRVKYLGESEEQAKEITGEDNESSLDDYFNEDEENGNEA